jgi:hypothetical protein
MPTYKQYKKKLFVSASQELTTQTMMQCKEMFFGNYKNQRSRQRNQPKDLK